MTLFNNGLKVPMFAFLFQAFFSVVTFNLIVFRLVGKSVLLFFFPFCLFVMRSLFLETRLIDMELHYPFLYFSLDDILLLISCILTQQRIVFLSSSYSLLTPIIEVCIVSLRWILRIGLSLQPLLIKLCTFAFQGAFN